MSAVALTKTLSSTSLSVPSSGANAAATPASVPSKGFFARIVDAVIAARTAQAEREVARYLALRDPGIWR